MEARASFDGAWRSGKIGPSESRMVLPFTTLLRAVPAGYLD